jgi:hypothetical protein
MAAAAVAAAHKDKLENQEVMLRLVLQVQAVTELQAV